MPALARPKLPRMTADEFIAWAMEQPEGERYELVGGEVVGMAPGRAAHARVKARVVNALADAIDRGGLACEAFPDGMAVRVSADTVYELDASVRCGPPVPDDTVEFADPVVVVEVLSPSTGARDTGEELVDYFLLPSVRHHLIVDTKARSVIHHARPGGGEIATRVVREGALQLDPPGIALDVAGLFLELVPKE